MQFEELKDFVAQRMRMSHVYQPLLIRLLVEAGGKATVRQLARGFAAEDAAQIAYYEARISQMPLPVLKRHGVVARDRDVVALNVGRLSFEESVTLQAECNRRISEFLAARGQNAWTGMLEAAPVADTVRFEVLRRDRVCQLCGAGPRDDVLEVDHVIPRSKGGSNDSGNLQVLCRTCNRGKSNRDDTAFR
jgi:ATP adenylyltransferase